MRGLLTTIALLLAMGLAACDGTQAETTPVARLVRVIEVGAADASSQRYTGVVRARIESDLGFRVGGKISERLVDVGQTVNRGQPLMRIDPADLALGTTRASERLAEAEAAATRAAADEERLRSLVETGAVSRQAYDMALATARSTAAGVAGARAAAQEAANQRSYATLLADADGVVMEVMAQPGQVVSMGTSVVRLGRAGTREALVSVPEDVRATLPQTAEASLYSDPSNLFPASLRELSATADPLTRTFAARYSLAGQGASAPLGSTVTVQVRSDAGGGMAVPLSALRETGTGAGVWVVAADGRVRLRQVRVAKLGEEDAVLVNGALRPGERVVALGAHLLREGEAVRTAGLEDVRR